MIGLGRLLGPVGLGGERYDVNGRVVLITGAGQGIGRELAAILHRRGARIAVVDIDAAAAETAARDLGSRALGVGADVADRQGMEAAVAWVIDHFGRLDVVVANAGVVPEAATLRTMTGPAFDRVMAINLTGVYNTVHPALDQIVAHRGHVVVVSSCAAFAPGMAGSPYMISKAAVEQLGRALRVELAGFGASAGVSYFGVVETEMTRSTLDRDPLGHELDSLLPWPLNVRISATEAATVIADGIARRAPRTVAPLGWQPYALLRGAVNVVLDSRLANDTRMHDLVRRVEQRARP